MIDISRRKFLRTSMMGAAAVGLGPTLLFPRKARPLEAGTTPHPNVDGLRVVGVHDPRMTRDPIPVAPWKIQEKLVVDGVVAENLDRMARALTSEREARRAWKAIFLCPPGKSWSEVVVAIKTNNIGRQHSHSAVMARVCRVLVEDVGVQARNIVIYDGVHGKNLSRRTPFRDLPDGCRVLDRWGGVDSPVGIPGPWENGAGQTSCLKSLARGEVDILVNLSMCKGHSAAYGGFTMTMKNHLGTFEPKHAHREGRTDYLLSINRSPQILGEISDRTGEVLFPRQQLCIVDALWASAEGPMCEPSVQPNRLFMGTFSPVLDYVLAHRFRKDTMGWVIDEQVTGRFLSTFGIDAGRLPGGGTIVDAMEV